MVTAQKPKAPASAPNATKTSTWSKLFGGGGVDAAASELETRQKKLDDAEKKANGMKNGGMVKVGKGATPYKCK